MSRRYFVQVAPGDRPDTHALSGGSFSVREQDAFVEGLQATTNKRPYFLIVYTTPPDRGLVRALAESTADPAEILVALVRLRGVDAVFLDRAYRDQLMSAVAPTPTRAEA